MPNDRSVLCTVLIVISGLALASEVTPKVQAAEPQNVILLMLDGVRYREFFNGPDPQFSRGDQADTFPFLHSLVKKEGVLLGNRSQGSSFSTSDISHTSLPCYQSIFAGRNQALCFSNGCGRITEETFPERLVHDLNLPREQVASISSWSLIPQAFEHVAGTTFTNAGLEDMIVGTEYPLVRYLNQEQKKKSNVPPWEEARFDKYTIGQAMHYLQTQHPRFLYISLDDTDDEAHNKNYRRWIASLRRSDTFIQTLVTALDQMGEYGKNTTLLITTDHGRGDGKGWNDHGYTAPGADRIWLYSVGPHTRSRPVAVRTVNADHRWIRPTIEALMGLKPQLCKDCGQVIPEVLGQ